MKQSTISARTFCLAVMASVVAPVVRSEVVVTVDPSKEIGPVKIMNAVNNGPSKARADQSRGNFADYRALRIPFARTHDSINQATSSGHTVDISAVFPNFDADENDPKNYDFAFTDVFLETILAAGTEPFFRLGQTIENGAAKKYHIFPPKDFAKWARICEHVIRHCNEGWCGGHEWNIRYWEIWNEPDAQPDEKKAESCQWQGTKAEFFEFYKVVAQHLKRQFPDLKIGGPALGFRQQWADEFLAYQKAAGTEIDFFSWHDYGRRPDDICHARRSAKTRSFRKLLDKRGYAKTESILNEWNYVKDWTDDFPYSCRAISEPKGGAYTAAFMSICQDEPVDMLMYYDARPGTVFNGLFDIYTLKPRPAYYALLAWSWLRDLGVQVDSAISFPGREKLVADALTKEWKEWYYDYESPGCLTNELVTAVAAAGGGKVGVFITRFCDDDNVTAPEKVTVRLAKGAYSGIVRCFVTDAFHSGSAMTVIPEKNGSLVLSMEPNSFVYIEAELGHFRGSGSVSMPEADEIRLEGDYSGHLQDVWYDGAGHIYWAHTLDLVKTDLKGRILKRVAVEGHHAGIEVRNGRVYVAVCPMQSTTGGKTTPECRVTIGEYDAETLELVAMHKTEICDRSGSLAILEDGTFLVGCLRPQDIRSDQVRLHHLDRDYRSIRTYVLDNVPVRLGIEVIKRQQEGILLNLYGEEFDCIRLNRDFREVWRGKLGGPCGLVLDGAHRWVGETDMDETTKRWVSKLVRK